MTELPEAPQSTADSHTEAASLDVARTRPDAAETQADVAEAQADAAETHPDAAGTGPDAERSRADAGGGVVVVTNGQRGPAGIRPA